MNRQFREILKDEQIVAGYDMAAGVNDYCAVQFISKTKMDVPLVIHSNKTASDVTNDVVRILEKIYNITQIKPCIAPETNAGGSYEIDRMLAMNRLNWFDVWQQPTGIGMITESEPKKYGWTTTSSNRGKMLSDLKQAIDNRVLKIYDKKTINEMYSFVVVRSSSIWKAQAELNAHDDLIMSLSIAYQLYLNVDRPKKASDYEHVISEFPKEAWKNKSFY